MRIPQDALIPMEKLTAYLLVHREWNDKSKFLARAGFTRENPHLLLAALRDLAATSEAIEDKADEYGTFLRAEGRLKGPNGRTLEVVTIWMRSRLDDQIRFVTMKPKRRRGEELEPL